MNAVMIKEETPLQVYEQGMLRQELALDQPPKADAELRAKADAAVEKLLKIDPADIQQKQEGVEAIESMAADLQKMSARRSGMLKETIQTLARTGEDGGPVANALVELQAKVEDLDPNQFDFSSNWLRRTLGSLPFVGTPLAQYFARYQSADAVISNIVASLEKGRDQLKRDIITLDDDQRHMSKLSEALKQVVAYARMVDQVLAEKVDNDLLSDDPRTPFIKEELQFPLRQRIVDLQQQQLVAQQAILTLEVIKRNNKELIRGVSRALSVTVNALQVAVTLALALANQRIVLQKIETVNRTTENLLAETSAQLKTQGAAIHKQAASAQLSMDTLRQSFADVRAAIQDITGFRHEALPKMAESILEMDGMIRDTGTAIAKMEEGKRASERYGLEIIDLSNES